MTVLDFLTGGVYSTFKELFIALIEWFITFITNTIYLFFNPIIELIFGNFPDISSHVDTINSFFNYIANFIVYILDASLLYKTTIIFCIGSIIYRITYNQIVLLTKIVVKWWHYIVP